MSEDRDPAIQALFAEATEELEDQGFSAGVMARTRGFQLRLLGGAGALTVLTLATAWLFSVPLMDFALLLTQALGNELIAVADSRVAWALTPINNYGAVLVAGFKLLRMLFGKARDAAYVN